MKNLILFLTTIILFSSGNIAHAQTELLNNGNFETPGAYWSATGNFYYNSNFSNYHSPISYAFVSACPTCGTAIDNALGNLSQTISVPAGITAMTLSFWSYISTSETTTTSAYDILYVTISNGSTTDYVQLSNLNATSGYVLNSYTVPDFALFAGGTVTLNFQATTDISNPTQFRIDDASLMATVPCTYSLSSSSYTCPSSGANTYSGISTVTAPGGCSWTANVTSGSSWLSTSSSGVGSGAVSITVSANTSSSPRTGTINVGGNALTVTQPGISCSYSLSPSTYTCPNATASTYSSISTVTTPSGCSWTANVTSGGTWLSTSSSGTGSGSVSINVTANTGTSSRTGIINVSGQTLTVIQPGISCAYSLSPSSYSCASSSASTYTSIAAVTAPSGCSWVASVTSGGSWLSTSSSGSGSGAISIVVAANTGTSSRTGTIDVSGQILTVTQPGMGCTYSLSSSTYNCASSLANSYTNISTVTAPSGCGWTANVTAGSTWLSTSSSGTGSGSISINVTANTGTSARTGTIDVSGQTLTVIQPGIGSSALPDLIIIDPSVNINSLCPLESTDVTYTIDNTGSVFAGSSVTSFYLATAPIFNSLIDHWLVNDTIPSIAATGSVTHTVPITIPAGTTTGTWYIFMYANVFNTVIESNDSNNTSFVSVDVTPCSFTSVHQPFATIEAFTIYPNPTNGAVNISLKGPYTSEKGDLIIYNLLGEQIFSRPLCNTSKYDFDLSSLPNGLYFVQLKTPRENITKKFELLK